MKRKLQLNRETLRSLEDSKLAAAQGGLVLTQIPSFVSCHVSCDGTCLYSQCFC